MITFAILTATHIAAFVLGFLCFRNNAKKVTALEKAVKSAID